MNRAPSSPVEPSASIPFETELATSPNPAWVIDVTDGRVLAANKMGAFRLGLGGESTAILDETMPTLARLREISKEKTNKSEFREQLTFWTKEGLEKLNCIVHRKTIPPHAPLFVEIVKNKIPAGDALCSPQKDLATMAKIAKAIRASQPIPSPTDENKGATSPSILEDNTEIKKSEVAPSTVNTSSDQSQQAIELARLAHELKTPLSAIVAAAEIMKDERLGPIANERYGTYATDIYTSARHALAVISNMLGKPTAASKSSSHLELIFTDVDLGLLVDSTVSTMRPIAQQAGIALSLDGEAHLPHIIADTTSLQQILLNLLTNAIKFTGDKGQIIVRTRHASDGKLLLSVHDTGPGISDEEIARVHNATGQPAPRAQDPLNLNAGLGLGLPLVKMLATANGAQLHVERATEGGTVIVISFDKSRVIPV